MLQGQGHGLGFRDSGAFRNLKKEVPGGTFQLYIFKSVQILAIHYFIHYFIIVPCCPAHHISHVLLCSVDLFEQIKCMYVSIFCVI